MSEDKFDIDQLIRENAQAVADYENSENVENQQQDLQDPFLDLFQVHLLALLQQQPQLHLLQQHLILIHYLKVLL